MKDQLHYPKILILNQNVFNKESGGGITLTNLFRDWPKNRIACAYTDILEPDTSICDNLYFLRDEDFFYFTPRLTQFARNSRSQSSITKGTSLPISQWILSSCIKRTARVFFGDHVPSFARLSGEFIKWVEKFEPDIVYSFLGNLGYIQLCRKVCSYFRLPLVIHIMDNWPMTLYRNGIANYIFRRWMLREFDGLLRTAVVRMAISRKMCDAFRVDYGYSFVPFHNALDISLWLRESKNDWNSVGPFRIVYSGSIEHNQIDSLLDICNVVGKLSDGGLNIEMIIHSASFYIERYGEILKTNSAIKIGSPPTQLTIAHILGGADLLIVATNFDDKSEQYFRYSMPTKLPAYMISGTPVLLYGPKTIASIQYAEDEGWGYTVTQRSQEKLRSAFRELMDNRSLRKQLGQRAKMLACRNHNALKVRRAFQETLIKAAYSNQDRE